MKLKFYAERENFCKNCIFKKGNNFFLFSEIYVSLILCVLIFLFSQKKLLKEENPRLLDAMEWLLANTNPTEGKFFLFLENILL